MEGFPGLILVAVAGSIAILVFRWRLEARQRHWRAAADAAGLTDVRLSEVLGFTTSLGGNAGGLKVTLKSYQRGKQEHGTRIVISGLRHGSFGLSIRPEGVTTSIEKVIGERELEVGDPGFDGAAYIQGSAGLVRAIFDAGTRSALRPLLEGRLHVTSPAGSRTFERVRFSLSDDELRADFRSSIVDNTEEWLPAILPRMIAIAERLRRPDDLAARIAANTRTEAIDEVRLANIRTLASDFPGHEAARGALRAALEDTSPAVRLRAAVALGAEGQTALLDLSSGDAPDEIAAQAIRALGPALTADRALARLRRAREAEQPAAARACVEALGASRGAGAVEALVETLASAPEDLAAAAARALGQSADASAEEPLVAAMGHEAGVVRVAAAEALGRIGTPLAVVPLREAASAHLLDGDLRRAARQAVAEIQSRVSGATPGQLSLADDQSGRLSLAGEDRRGQVSLAQAGDAASAERRARAAQAAQATPQQPRA